MLDIIMAMSIMYKDKRGNSMTNSINGNEELFKDIDNLCAQTDEKIEKAMSCLTCRVPATDLCACCNHGLNIQ